MNILRLLLNIPFVAANGVTALLWIVSAYSDRFSPDTSLLFSYLGLAFPVLTIVNLCFIFYWIFLTEWRFLLMNLLVIVVCVGPIKQYYPFHSAKAIPAENTLKVLTYNVMSFGYVDHTQEHPNPILDYIAHSQADIVCLQEYTAPKSGKQLTQAKVFSALKMYPYHAIIYLGTKKRPSHGIAVFSKYPIERSERISYASDANGSAMHQIKINGKKLTLINNHLESFKLTSEDRSRYSAFIKSLSAEGFDDLKGAFTQKLGPAFQIRAKQAETIAQKIQAINTDYLLVCGDFNDTPISYAHRTIQGELLDAFSEAGKGLGITYNQNFFWFKIDHILHSANMQALQCQVEKIAYSDHYPIWCVFHLE